MTCREVCCSTQQAYLSEAKADSSPALPSPGARDPGQGDTRPGECPPRLRPSRTSSARSVDIGRRRAAPHTPATRHSPLATRHSTVGPDQTLLRSAILGLARSPRPSRASSEPAARAAGICWGRLALRLQQV